MKDYMALLLADLWTLQTWRDSSILSEMVSKAKRKNICIPSKSIIHFKVMVRKKTVLEIFLKIVVSY